INGQKVWTSGIHFADWMILLARTDAEAPKHRGISFFLVDVKTAGIEHRPLVNITGSHEFNEVFFTDVRIPAANLVGELNRGWYVAQTTLSFERSNVGNAIGQRQVIEDLAVIARGDSEVPMAGRAGPAIRDELAERWIEAGVATLMAENIVSLQAAGVEDLGSEAAAAKMFSMELNQRIYRTGNRVTGPWSQLMANGNGYSPFGGRLPLTFLRSVANTIEGGTSEVQRNIVAVRRLGLPR
ncbi:MAG: acyl-CoA dehydrogenase family protein, partial [Dehalococcoidia bacterium]